MTFKAFKRISATVTSAALSQFSTWNHRKAHCVALRPMQSRTRVLMLLAWMGLILGGSPVAFAQEPPSFDSVQVGAYDAKAWNGVMFLAHAFDQQATFAFRVGAQRVLSYYAGDEILNLVNEVGPNAPDSSYSRMSWRLAPSQTRVTLEWSRIDETTVVGQLTTNPPTETASDALPNTSPAVHLVLEAYLPYSSIRSRRAGFYDVDMQDGAILGQRFFDRAFGKTAWMALVVNRPLTSSGTFLSIGQMEQNMQGGGQLVSSLAGEPNHTAAGMVFVPGPTGKAQFVAKIGWGRDAVLGQSQQLLRSGRIDSILRDKSEAYAQSRPKVTGLFEGGANAIGNSMFWNTLYAPSSGLIFPSISRHWAITHGGWVTGQVDGFLGSLLTGLQDKAQTEAIVKAILMTQAPDGRIPGELSGGDIVEGHSQPPIGAYSVWKLYERFHDKQFLEWAYDRLKKGHEWWFGDRGDGQPRRDGNRDGLLEWGSDRGPIDSAPPHGFLQAAKWESLMDDSPMYDHATYNAQTYTMDLDDVGLNSLYALDAETLKEMALILGRDADARHFSEEYARVKQLMQSKLWNEEDGIFENRYWDGRFSKRLSPTNFYPLFAGIATQEQAEKMVTKHLLNPKEFWGTYVIPTISRDDPAFAGQWYWRGAIWGPTNYMVYEGLNRYRFDDVALEYAQKSYELFMDDWRHNQHDNEEYLTWGGNGGGDAHYTWGALLCLVSLEQYIDENPWEGLRFGMLNPPSTGEFQRSNWNGHSYDVGVGPEKTKLSRDGSARFEANAGVVVRHYQIGPSTLSFTVKSDKIVRITTSEFDSGEFNLKIDNRAASKITVRQGSGSFDIPSGEHSVELVK